MLADVQYLYSMACRGRPESGKRGSVQAFSSEDARAGVSRMSFVLSQLLWAQGEVGTGDGNLSCKF